MAMRGIFYVVCVACFVGNVLSVPMRLFYPYGPGRGDQALSSADDTSSPEIQLQTPVNFYDGFYTSIFVNSNGHLTFETEIPVIQPTMVLPLGREIKMIAAWMSDIDLGQGGAVYYRETTDDSLLQRVAADVKAHFSTYQDFEPLGLFIATWDNVISFEGDPGQTNTFQIVIASDELNSFVIFNYLDDGISWTKSKGKFAGVGRPDPPAQAGFDSGVGSLHFKLPYSGTEQVQLLAQETNVNVPGVWMYHVGHTKGGNVVGPDLNTGDETIFEPELEQNTCAQDRARQCHVNATCTDFTTGFCCRCNSPMFGNGRNCINPLEPQRLNGKVSGTINGVEFSDLDMHAFVVTKDGRAYTAISRVPDEISPQLMTLNTIGGIIGWMFALRGGPGAKNGYMYTGGNLNRTARISYQAGGEVTIRQTYFGQNVLNSIRLETHINGTIPEIEGTDRITVDDYKEEYRRVDTGRIRSTSDRTFRANDVSNRYTWDQEIMYDECTHAPVDPNDRSTQRLSVTRNFVVYDPNDRVVRFAMSNSISAMSGSDPCLEGARNCDQNADCIPQGNTYTCECRTGFIGDGSRCEDLDECAIDFVSTCDVNAVCTNTIGSFRCQCSYGFRGDGRSCVREVTLCGDKVCDDNARCVYNDVEQRPMCECKSGFRDVMGDGTDCQRPIEFQCNEADICHENAECLYDDVSDRYYCACPEGFSGDGLYCESTTIETACDCDPNAYCVTDPGTLLSQCYCRQGYTGDGRTCTYIDNRRACDECHPRADCVYDQSMQAYTCRCLPGYVGNGTFCSTYDCRDNDICDVNARCTQDFQGRYVCACLPGYRGDGRRCEPEGCNVLDNCDVNAQCVPDPRDTSRYMCRCNPGYTGNGQVCIKRVVPCNEVNNCGVNAQCVYDPATLDYRCRCNRGFDGDGFTCRVRGVDCQRLPDLCDPNADCILNVDTYMCVCKSGYRGDGAQCQRVSDEMNYLLFSRGYSIHKVPYVQNGLDSDGTRVLYVPDELAIGVTADCGDQKFYWTDVSHGRISRANLDGFDKQVVFQGFSSPEGIAIDFVARNIYVTDSGYDTITVINLNGTSRKTVVSGDMRDPRSIALDPQKGVMFWTDWYRNSPAIERANMDGSARQVFIEADLGLPNGLSLDTYTQQLCWGDAGTSRIECIRTDGVGRRVITENSPYPFDIAMYGNTVYWADWTMKTIPSVDINSGELGEELSLPVGGNGRLYGIAAVGEFCPRVTNACYRNNGGCRYLCLPTPNGGRTCACPDEVDDVTCSEIGTLRKK